MSQLVRTALLMLSALLLAGCFGSNPGEIFVSTTPPGATCTLSRNGQPVATASPTPAIALVDPSAGDLTVTCRREGYADATMTLPAKGGWPGMATLMYGAVSDAHHRRVDIALVAKPPGRAAR
jgi:hypothetical protein